MTPARKSAEPPQREADETKALAVFTEYFVPLYALRAFPTAAPDSFAAGVEAAIEAIATHRPDASFDDSQSGVIERQALLANIIAEVRALAPTPTKPEVQP